MTKNFFMVILIVAGLVTSVRADLVLYLPFDTDASDASNYDNDGNFLGASSITGDSKIGDGALNVPDQLTENGVKGATANGFSYGNDPWTLSCWVKTTDDKHCLLGWGKSGAAAADRQNTNLFLEHNRTIRISHWLTDRDCTTSDTIKQWDDGNWHLVTGTYDGITQILYIDGEVVVTRSNHLPLVNGPAGNGYEYVVGRLVGGFDDNSQICTGQIDDVAVFNHALTAEEVELLWNNGNGNPASILMRGVAHDPYPGHGDDNIEAATISEVTWMSPDNPDDPNIIAVNGYDVYFGSDPNISNNPMTSVTTESLPVSLEVDTIYYLRIDSKVVWDVNDVEVELIEGPVWNFTTLPLNPAPVVFAGDDIITAMEFLPAVLAGAVDDEDIDSILWEIVGYPDDPPASGESAARSWYRDQNPDAIYDPDLLREGINSYSRYPGDPLTLVISGLPDGTYSWKSYHHDGLDITGDFDFYITDANGQTKYTGYKCTVGPAADESEIETVVLPDSILVSGGNDVKITIDCISSYNGSWGNAITTTNGFDLTDTSGSLNIDFGPVGNNPLQADYQAYDLTDNDAAANGPVDYSAFGVTVTLDPEWGAYAAGFITASISDKTINLATPTAALTTDTPGTYRVKLTAWDSIAQEGFSTVDVSIGANACAAAQLSGSWTGYNYYDRDEDCDVDLVDFAAFAAEWLDNRNLKSQN